MSLKIVPNEFPTIEQPYRLAIVGEAPSAHDVSQGRPFAGPSGNLLNGALQACGVMRSACFVGNVCQHQPPYNDIEYFDKKGDEIQSGLRQLKVDLNKFQPHCVLLLGNTPLWASGSFHKVSVYRGTLFKGFDDRFKCIASFHPSAVLRQWDWAPLMEFDIRRAVSESSTPELILPKRKLDVTLSPPEIIQKLRAINPGTLVSLDIEGGVPQESAATVERKHRNGVTCVSISTSPDYSFIIPLQDYDDQTLCSVMSEFAKVMKDPSIPKVLQNSLYDYVVLAYLWKLPIVNILHDTMLSGWEIYPELPKGLGVQASIWTKEPYYKFERTSGTDLPESERKQLHYSYCCKDSAVTLEIHHAHLAAMTPEQRKHYEFNMELIEPLQYMSLKGIRYDKPASDERKSELAAIMRDYQTSCNTLAGQEINMNSPKQMTDLLYRKLGLEPQYKLEHGRKTNKLTADSDAMLNLVVKGGNSPHPFLLNCLAWKKLEGERKQLEIDLDIDGRVRCSYNLVGAETGRLSCSGSVTGSGTNLQTIMKANRRFYLSDEDHYFFQCDLEGADGWTVAAHCASLGDPTMIEDYYAKLKPAKIIALMHVVGQHVNTLPREELKKLLKTTEIPKHIYDVCKVVQHGSNYGMGANRMSENLLEKSFKKSSDSNILYVPPRDCKVIQALYFKRYPGVLSWQRWVEQQLQRGRQLGSASGHIRTFFGRPGDQQTLKAALAHEPQANTTYATNLAMWKLWKDPENRDSTGRFIIQPLHSVHDALCGQFPISRTEWAVEKIRSYFNNTLRIGNENILIPFEGGYGKNWYETGEDNRIGEI